MADQNLIPPFEGQQLRMANGNLYFVWQGIARYIPNMDVHGALFGSYNVFVQLGDYPVPALYLPSAPPVKIGDELGLNACILRNNDTGAEYFYDGQKAYFIPTGETYAFYHFGGNWKSIDDGSIDWNAIVQAGIGVAGAVLGAA